MKKYQYAICLLLTSLMISCNETVPNADTASVITDTETCDITQLSDELGEYDFNEKSFNIITAEGFFFSPYDPQEETGDILDDAAYQRNRNVEDRFNCKIAYTMLPGSFTEPTDELRKTIMSDDDIYTLGILHPYAGLTGIITDGLVMDWNTIPNVNFDKPWWNQSFNQTLSVDNILPCASSDFIYFNSGCIYFNKQLKEQYIVEDLYQLVYDGKWTWDKLAEISAKVALDLNGDSKLGAEDQYGYSIINNHRMVPVTSSCDISVASKGEDGYLNVSNINSEHMNNIVNTYYNLCYGNDATWLCKSDELALFQNGQVLFLHYVTQNIKVFRDLNFDYGILPLPKYDEQQENYYSLAQSNVMVIPVTVRDTTFAGTIIEALSSESYFNVLPVLYETTFNNKYLRDEESIAMFDIIKNSLVYDAAWNYQNGVGVTYFFSNLIGSASTDTASYYAKNHKAAEKMLRDFYDKTREAYEN